MNNFHVLRFEDIIDSPLKSIYKIYKKAGLELDKVSYFRLQIKRKTESDGKRSLDAERDRKVVWYTPETVKDYFDTDINSKQISQLDPSTKSRFEDIAKGTLENFQY
jgi:hypothetical protein